MCGIFGYSISGVGPKNKFSWERGRGRNNERDRLQTQIFYLVSFFSLPNVFLFVFCFCFLFILLVFCIEISILLESSSSRLQSQFRLGRRDLDNFVTEAA
jgi:hypothetical protein